MCRQIDDGAQKDWRGMREDNLEEPRAGDGDCGVVGKQRGDKVRELSLRDWVVWWWGRERAVNRLSAGVGRDCRRMFGDL
jgi:hypothetical protein